MTTGLMLFWLALTTIYGIIARYQGKKKGIQELLADLIEAKIVPSRESVVDRLEAHHKRMSEKYAEDEEEK